MSNTSNQTNNPNKLAIRPVRMKVFPTANTLNEAVEIMQASVPEEIWNEVYRNLMMYHNTLLKAIEDESLEKPETNDH